MHPFCTPSAPLLHPHTGDTLERKYRAAARVVREDGRVW